MKTGIILTLVVAALELNAHGGGAETNYGKAIIPLIVMNDAGLQDAVEALTHQAEIHCIFDPQVLNDLAGSGSVPLVNLRWTNVTAQIALDRLLKAARLVMVTNQVTTVARIVRQDQNVKPVSASQLGNDTNQVIPLVAMKEALLGDGIKSLARQANIAYIIDPALESPGPGSADGMVMQSKVSVRWEKLTARQALVALLDNYGLALVWNSDDNTPALLTTRARAEASTPKKPGP